MANKNRLITYVNNLVKKVKNKKHNVFATAQHSRRDKKEQDAQCLCNGATLSPEEEGRLGERLIEDALTHARIPGRSHTWTNVLVPADGFIPDETELDVIMLHERGVFVFESKYYSGCISGSEDKKYWTKSLDETKTIPFYNPINQNANHVKALSQELEVPEEDLANYVVFSNRCTLEEVPAQSDKFCVCQRDDLIRLVREDLDRREVKFSELQYKMLEQHINELKEASTPQALEFHAQDVRMAFTGNVCPRCGGKLKKIDGEYGPFMGCENFPKC